MQHNRLDVTAFQGRVLSTDEKNRVSSSMSIFLGAPRQRGLLGRAVIAMAALVATEAFAATDAAARTHDLAAIASFTIQLQNVGRDLDRLARSDHDLLIIEPTVEGGRDGRRPLSRSEVARLQTKPDGARRIVLAYMSVGEAEEYRTYWRSEWRRTPPSWLIAENCRWRRNHLVRFWDAEWQKLIVSGPEAILASIVEAGFDGVSLDRIDVFEELEHDNPAARADMIALVTTIASKARIRQPDFILLAHNAEGLLTDRRFRRTIDGVLKEDLLFGLAGTGRRNAAASIDWSNRRLAMLRDEGKPVLVAEYLTDSRHAEDTELELLDRNFLPGVFPRALDGSDPLRDAGTAKGAPGTPEEAASRCNAALDSPGSH